MTSSFTSIGRWPRVRSPSGTAPPAAASYTKILEIGNVPTLQAQDGITRTNYTKIGLYRWTDPVNTNVLFQDDFRRAASLDELGLVEAPNGDVTLSS